MSKSPKPHENGVDEVDAVLARAWELFLENTTDEVMDELEPLVPILVDAGYAEADEVAWRFTPKGVARAEELGLE
jgi:hypothetical protein